MFIYVGKNFTAALSGSVVRDVTCEKCGGLYHYRMVRRGQGHGTAPYYINQGGAQRRAEKGARKSLEKQLQRDIDPVPCPDCGWFQLDMIREVRKRSLRWLKWTGWILGSVLTLILVMWWGNVTKGFDREMSSDDFVVSIVLASAIVLAIAGPLMLRGFLLRQRDPNRAYPDRPELIPGAPKAYKTGDESAGDVAAPIVDAAQGALTYERRPPEVEPGGWVTVQLMGISVPRRCCACLTETHRFTVFKKGELVKVSIAHCPDCFALYSQIWWGWVIASTAIFALIATAITFIPAVAKEYAPGGRIVTAVAGAFIGWLFGLVLANQFAGPARIGRFDGRLNTLRIRFRNPNYAAVFVSDQPPPQPAVDFSVPIPRPART